MNLINKTPPAALSQSEIIQQLRSQYVATGDDAAFKLHLSRILVTREDGTLTLEPVRYSSDADTRGVIVTAPAGAGKTRLIGAALDSLMDSCEPGEDEELQPILRVTVPSPATVKSLGLELLEATGYKAIGVRQERWHIWSMVRHRLGLTGVKLLWLDEAQHLLSRKADVAQALDTLKTLMQGPNAAVIVLSGVPELDKIVSHDQQVGRRFSRMRLTEGRSPSFARRVAKIIAGYAEDAGLRAPDAPGLAEQLLHGVDGRFGLCFEVAIDAIAQALSLNAESLERQHFAEAWGLGRGCAPADNVFLVDEWAATPPLGIKPEAIPAKTAKRGKTRS
jgi:hypothetical protein